MIISFLHGHSHFGVLSPKRQFACRTLPVNLFSFPSHGPRKEEELTGLFLSCEGLSDGGTRMGREHFEPGQCTSGMSECCHGTYKTNIVRMRSMYPGAVLAIQI